MRPSQRISPKRSSREASERAAGAFKLPVSLERFVASQVEQGIYRTREAAIVTAVANAKRRHDPSVKPTCGPSRVRFQR